MNYKMLLLERARAGQVFCNEPSPFDYLQLRNYEALRAWYRRLAAHQAVDASVDDRDLRSEAVL